MHYLLFNNEILISDGKTVKKIAKERVSPELLGPMDKVRLCHVDVDVMIAAAPQDHLDKKDSLLAQKFEGQYPGGYIIQDEKIGNNIFQVIGIKADKVRDIYALIPSCKIEAFVPYAAALRALLIQKGQTGSKTVVFVDDLGNERLITVFDGLKFSRTRTLASDKPEEILPDIKRSQIDFHKKLREFSNQILPGDFSVIANNKGLVEGMKSLEPQMDIEFLDLPYPALAGLQYMDSAMKYRIPEDIVQERKNIERKAKLADLSIASAIMVCGIVFFGFNKLSFSYQAHALARQQIRASELQKTLEDLDPMVYRDALKAAKNLNYANAFFEISGLWPLYAIYSLDFTRGGGGWSFSAYLWARDEDFFDQIPRIKGLKNARIKDCFIQDRPGKYIKVAL